jgi:RNA polymerase sigma-70 factor, ECF subfamily
LLDTASADYFVKAALFQVSLITQTVYLEVKRIMAMHLGDEPELVTAAKSGSDEAFSTLISQYHRNIYRLTLRITGNHEDAEDAMQEALLKAYCKLGQFHGTSRFYTWLVRIAMNESLMRLRKRRSNRQVSLDEVVHLDGDFVPREIEDWSEDPEKRYAQLELRQILDRALERLGPRLCTAFLLRNADDHSLKETARILGLSVSAAKSRLVRARSRLRRRLKNTLPTHGEASAGSCSAQPSTWASS